MKTFVIVTLSLLATALSVNAAQYDCVSKDQKTSGHVTFDAQGYFVTGTLLFHGMNVKLATQDEIVPQGMIKHVVESSDFRAERGFEVMTGAYDGGFIFSMHPKDYHESPEMVSSVAYFSQKPMAHEFVTCTYTP